MTMFSNCACCAPAPASTGAHRPGELPRRRHRRAGPGHHRRPAVRAQTAKTKIDVHHHFLPPEHREALDQAQGRRSEMVGADVARGHGQERHRHRRCCRRSSPAPGGATTRNPASSAAQINEYGAKLVRDHPGPLRPVRDDHAARRRRQPEGDRIRLRHAEGRRRRPADQLRRQISRRCLVRAGLCRAQPPQGRDLRASAGAQLLRQRGAGHSAGLDRVRDRLDAHHRASGVQRHVAEVSGHPLDLLALAAARCRS